MRTIFSRIAVVGALLFASAADAQSSQWYETYKPHESLYLFNYEMASPLGSFSDDFISDTSFRGFSFEGRSMVRDNVSIGIGFTFNRWDQTYSNLSVQTASGGTLSGPVYRYADQFAIKGLAHLYLRPGTIRPYVGVGIGGVWAYSYAQTADFANTDDGFHFIVSPEAGLMLTAARGASTAGLNVGIRYNYTTAEFQQVTDAQSLTYVVGLFAGY